MATRFEDPCEGTNGTTVTVGNSDFSFVSVGNPPAYSTAQKFLGASSIDCSSTGTYRYCTFEEGSPSANWGVRMYFRMGGNPSVNATLLNFTSSGAIRAQVQVITDGKIRLRRGTTQAYVSTNSLALNTWYRLEVWVSASQIRMAVYAGDSLTTFADSGTLSYSEGTIGSVWFGNSVNTTWTTLYIDQVIATDTAAFPGPSTTPIGITTDANFSMLLGDSRSVSMTKSNGTNPTTWAWTVSGPNNSTSQFSAPSAQTTQFTPTAAGVYTLTGTGTDGTGSDSDTTQVTVTVADRMRFSRAVTIQAV